MAISTTLSRRIGSTMAFAATGSGLGQLAVLLALPSALGGLRLALGVSLALTAVGAFFAYRRLRSATVDRLIEIGERADRLSRNCIAGIERIASGMARGDLTGKLEATTTLLEITEHDEIGAIGLTLNGIISTCQASIAQLNAAQRAVLSIVNDSSTLNSAAEAGVLERRADVSRYQGSYAEVASGINRVMDAVALPLREASATLQRVADRDVSVRMSGSYRGEFHELQQAINAAVANLDQALQEVAVSAIQVGNAASQISAGSDSLAHGAADQAAKLEETSGSLTELASMAKMSASHAEEARARATSAQDLANVGVREMSSLSLAMDQIAASSSETARIVKTIDEIAFQTNLLALKPAVEAARAGDAGRGFAVVAEEVRSLAIRSAEAAKNTSQLIEDSVRHVQHGRQLNEVVHSTLQDINAQVTHLGTVIADMAATSAQQAGAVQQLSDGAAGMEATTQAVAGNAEESASAAVELSAQASTLKDLVTSFEVTGAVQRHSGRPRRDEPGSVSTSTGHNIGPRTSRRELAPVQTAGTDDEAVFSVF